MEFLTVVITDGSTLDETLVVSVPDGAALDQTISVSYPDGSTVDSTIAVTPTDDTTDVDQIIAVTVPDGATLDQTIAVTVTDGSTLNETFIATITDGSATNETFEIWIPSYLTPDEPDPTDDGGGYIKVDGVEGEATAGPGSPNILFIYLDDVGLDMMGYVDQIEFAINKYGEVPTSSGPNWADLRNIQTIANEGVVFNNAYNSATCSPGRAMWQSGRHQLRTGQGTVQREDNVTTSGSYSQFDKGHMEWAVDRVSDAVTEITLPSLFTVAGYKTCCVGKWHLSLPNGSTDPVGAFTAARWWNDDPKTGLDYGRIPWNIAPSTGDNAVHTAGYVSHGWKHPQKVGWEHFRGVINNLDRMPTTDLANTFTGSGLSDAATSGQKPGYHNYVWYDSVDNAVTQSVTYVTKYSRLEVEDYIKNRTGDDPWFVCWNLSAAHSPFGDRFDNGDNQSGCRPPSGEIHSAESTYNDMSTSDAAVWNSVRACLENVDLHIGQLRTSLGSTIWANTMVVIMGDNGTPDAVLDAGVAEGESYGSYYINNVINASEAHLKTSLYEGGIKVPLLVSGPLVGGTAGRKSMEPVFITDIFATFLNMIDVEMPTKEGTYFDSYSFLSVLQEDKGQTARKEIFVENTELNGFPGFSDFDYTQNTRDSVLITRFTDEEYGSYKGTYKMHLNMNDSTSELYKLRDATQNNVDSYESNDLDDNYGTIAALTDPRRKIRDYMRGRIQYYYYSNGGPNLEQGYDT